MKVRYTVNAIREHSDSFTQSLMIDNPINLLSNIFV